MITEKWIEEKGKPGANSSSKNREGDFEVIFDEAGAMNAKKKEKKIFSSGSSKK